MLENLTDYIYIVVAALFAIILHEIAHGLVSTWLGDPTPKRQGRLSLNPLKHLDPIGALCLVFFHFGWAKPVVINPSYYKNKKIGMTLVALAGPIMNFIITIISFIIIGITFAIQYNNNLGYNVVFEIIYNFFSYLAILNIGLGVFNLIPIPPLDGSKAIGVILPKGAYEEYMGYQKYGTFFMMGIMLVIYILSFFNIESPILKITESIYTFFMEIIYKIVI